MNIDDNNFDDAVPALERMPYATFQRTYTSWKMGDFMRRVVELDDIQLPTNSVFHVVDNLLDPDNITATMNPDNKFAQNETGVVYISHVLSPVSTSDKHFPAQEKYRFQSARYTQQVAKFRSTYGKLYRHVIDPSSALNQTSALTTFCYNPIFGVRIRGVRLANLRRFDIVFRTILSNVIKIFEAHPTKHQFIQLPMSATTVTRAQITRTSKAFSPQTIKVLDDMSYYAVLHFVGVLAKHETSLLTQLPEETLSKINFIFQCGQKCAIYNLGTLLGFSEKNSQFFDLIRRHLNVVKLAASNADSDPEVMTDDEIEYLSDVNAHSDTVKVSSDQDSDSDADSDTDSEIQDSDDAHQMPETEPIRNVKIIPSSDEEPSAFLEDSEVDDFSERLSEAAKTAVANSRVPLSEPQKAAALSLARQVRDVQLNGVSVGRLLSSEPDPIVTSAPISSVEDYLSDKSMAKSSISKFDETYISKQMDKDLASVLTSFVGSGMILSDVQSEDTRTEFNAIRTYRVSFYDLTRKKHTTTIKVPIVDSDGTMTINGVKTRMVKQQVNLPICKVSDRRVNLSSNYNKTLVERSSSASQRFDVHLKKVLSALQGEDLISLEFGSSNITSVKLPYDYTCIASSFVSITAGRRLFTFDYRNRLPASGAGEAAHSKRSYIEHRSEIYDLTKLFEITSGMPQEKFGVSNLEWIIEGVKFDEARVAKADASLPVFVVYKDGKSITIDGRHRLVKAIRGGKETIRGITITDEMLKRALVTNPLTTDMELSTRLLLVEKYFDSVYCGVNGDNLLFYGQDNVIREIDGSRKNSRSLEESVISANTIREILIEIAGDKVKIPRPSIEWAELKLLDKNFPIVVILGYKFGFSEVLKRLKHPYRTVPSNTRVKLGPDEIVVQFSDQKLIFSRYPLKTGLILSGLLRFDFRDIELAHLDDKDTYYTILAQAKLSMNYLKGIEDFFDYFVDPITKDVLTRIGEPTTPGGLLVRAAEMVSTRDHIQPSSMRNHRLRGYERFPDIIYNELSRGLARHRNMRGKPKPFSLNPEQVFLKIISDPTVQPLDELGPIHAIKMNSLSTYGGSGGRTAQSFVVNDRIYPDDALGILSEATPDSGKVAINSYMSVDPKIGDIRGIYSPESDLSKLEPSNTLSVAALLMPGVMHDDSKRISYASIQLSHHVPCENGEVSRVRTGFERVVAHQAGETFACIAEKSGRVTGIDNDLKVVEVTYDPEPIKADRGLSLNIGKTLLQSMWDKGEPLFYTIPRKVLKLYPVGKKLLINKLVIYEVAEGFPIDTVENIPDKSKMTKDELAFLGKAEGLVYLRLTPVKSNPKEFIDVFKFGDKYTSVSGSYIKQPIVLNVTEGDRVKAGDVIAYNSGFFVPDQDSKQVDWKHGVMATVAFIDRPETYEDSCQISESLSKKVMSTSGHVRTVRMNPDTAIKYIVSPGDHVETVDHLMIMEDASLDALGSDDSAADDIIIDLNRKLPRAKYHGKIVSVDVYYSCTFDELHPSIKSLIRAISKHKAALISAMKDTKKEGSVSMPSSVPVGTKFLGIDFADNQTVAVVITISEDLACVTGDKLVIASQAKTVVGSVMERQALTESGADIDMFFSASGVANRMLTSHLIVGIGEVTLEKLEKDIVEEYFS